MVVAGKTTVEPSSDSLPCHPPDATQEFAPLLDQDKVEPAPAAIAAGTTLSATVGSKAPTVRATDAGVVPPGPVQESV